MLLVYMVFLCLNSADCKPVNPHTFHDLTFCETMVDVMNERHPVQTGYDYVCMVHTDSGWEPASN